VSDSTVSDFFAGAVRSAEPRRSPVLYVVFRASAPFERPSRHLLDGVDVVCFGRGEPRAKRDRAARRLTVRVPDPVMSADHGRLIRAHGQWLLEDPGSKNGAVVEGRPTRASVVQPGELFMLGHSFFLLDTTDVLGALPADRFADQPPPPSPPLATLDEGLGHTIDLLRRAAPSDVPVLLLGDTGTGKEVFARALHAMSGRRGAFVAVNCGGLAPTLVESELFGHRKGTFSGALHDRPGYLRSADGGTLFLDEIAELPLPAQASLLRALQLREVVPVGDSLPVSVDLRVCAATHRNLADMVAAGTFREDLYARLLGISVSLPPLRHRRCDLGLLIAALLRGLRGGDRARFTPDAAYALLRYPWPMNVRELERSLAAALALAGRDPIERRYLPAAVTAGPSSSAVPAPVARPAGAVEPPVDRARLEELLRAHAGNVRRVAEALHTSRSQVRRLAERFALKADGFRAHG